MFPYFDYSATLKKKLLWDKTPLGHSKAPKMKYTLVQGCRCNP